MSVSFCLPHPVDVSVFIICGDLCACTEMLWKYVLYVSFGYRVSPRTFGCVAMRSAVLFIFRSRLLLYSVKVQVVLSGFSVRLFCFVQEKTLCMYGCMYFLAALVLVWWWCHLRRSWPELVLLVVVCLQCMLIQRLSITSKGKYRHSMYEHHSYNIFFLCNHNYAMLWFYKERQWSGISDFSSPMLMSDPHPAVIKCIDAEWF